MHSLQKDGESSAAALRCYLMTLLALGVVEASGLLLHFKDFAW